MYPFNFLLFLFLVLSNKIKRNMSYIFTKIVGGLFLFILFLYIRFKRNNPIKSRKLESSVIRIYSGYKFVALVAIGMVFILYLIYKTESRLYMHESTIKEYKIIHEYLMELSKREEDPSYEKDGIKYKKLRELQYFTSNDSLRYAIKGKDYEIAAEILQKKMEEKYPELIKTILCDEFAQCMVSLRGRPIVRLASDVN